MEVVAADARFTDNAGRITNIAALAEIIERVFSDYTTDEVVRRLDGAGVPCGPIYTVPQVFADPQVQHAGLERRIEQNGLPNRCVLALADAAIGYRVRNPTYRNAADVTEATAGRDLRALVKAGYLQPVGDKRGRHYVAADGLRELAQRYAEKKLVGDPFAAAG